MIEFVNNMITLIKSNSLIYLFIFVFYICMFVSSRRITIPFISFASVLSTFVFAYLSSTKIFVVFLSLSLFVFVSLLSKKKSFNFNKGILSLGLLYNILPSKKEKGSKTIGRIIPYSEWQLKYNFKKINMSSIALKGITMITGSPGSGKTYQMKELVKQDLDSGKPVVFFDFKGDHKIIEELSSYADMLNIPTYEMSAEKIDFNYDPLSNINTAGKVETLLNTRKWSLDGSDAHYRSSTQLVIQKIVNEFDSIWDNKGNYLIGLYRFTKKYNCEKSLYQGYETLLKLLEILLTSNLKSAWLGENDKDFSFNIKGQYLILFSFMSSNKELANSISSFVVKDLLDTGTKESFEDGLAFYIDETGTLENSFILKDLLEKGRSCGIETTLSLQDINQIVINTNQAYLNSILGVINSYIIYSGSTKLTAEIMSGVQTGEIDKIIMSLKKPHKGKAPTAIYISRYPSINKDRPVDVFKIRPYTRKETVKLSVKNEPKIEKLHEPNDLEDFNKEEESQKERISSHNFSESIDEESNIITENDNLNTVKYEDFL